VLVTEQASAGAVTVAVKLLDAPAARLVRVNTVVLLFATTTLFKVTLPGLLTVPVYVSTPPGATDTAGHTRVTAMRGLLVTGQVMEALFDTVLVVQKSLPLAVSVVVTEQALTGAVKLPVKLAEAPGASEAAVNTTVFGAG